MNKRVITIALVIMLIAGSLLTGCELPEIVTDSGTEVTREFDFADFTRVEVSGAFTAELVPSATYAVSVTAGEDVFSYIEVSRTGDTLKIGMKPLTINFGSVNPKATVSLPELRGLSVSGASRVTASGFNPPDAFDLTVSGASEVELDIATENLDGIISGASEVSGRLEATDTRIVLSGASNLDADITAESIAFEVSGASHVTGQLAAAATRLVLAGASNFDMTGDTGDTSLAASGASNAGLSTALTMTDADITLTGASKAKATVDGTLNVTLSSASELGYSGNPTLGEVNVTGASKFYRQ